MTKLAAILDQIDSGSVLLPEFQRGYVWNRDQVRGLMRSLYRGYPVGGLLTWETHADGSLVRRVSRKVFCAGHEGFLRPRMVRSRAVSYLILRMVAAIFV
ncbi:MAG: GmrSD restriction endonuclease domain-containing protein, partial [Streptosporangiaceae bacterium]